MLDSTCSVHFLYHFSNYCLFDQHYKPPPGTAFPLSQSCSVIIYHSTHSSPPPTIPAKNPGAPHTTTINTTAPMPTLCTNEPPNHHAHLGYSLQLTYNGANLPHPHAKHSLVTPTMHQHWVYIHVNSLDSAFQRHIACYYAMPSVHSTFIPQPLYLTYIHSSLWKIHNP